eukprot:TRINITY_DN19789_c0_g1_i1.p1 TRINITY_DN19789_c0_g1~~TRINITY_DN19789_c0_g1_i1.p1  ORF type:complete len:539 (-),score=104.52 TRINITY_DN19789_c0_g1_i1:58-1605(-)
MAAYGLSNTDFLLDVMEVLLRKECLPLNTVYANKALFNGIAASVEVRLDADLQSEWTAALASTFSRRRIVKLHLSGQFFKSLQQVQPFGWNAIMSLTLYKFQGGITALPPNLQQLCLHRTELDADMIHIITTTAPASLHSLELLRCSTPYAAENISFPSTLRTFVCARTWANAQPFARAFRYCLPEGLRHLHLAQWHVPDGMLFPASLESLYLQQCIIGTRLGGNGEGDNTGEAPGSHELQQQHEERNGMRLPAGLRVLVLAGCDYKRSLGILPPHLVSFTAHDCFSCDSLKNDWEDDADASALGERWITTTRYTWSLAPLPLGLVRLQLGSFNDYNSPLGPLPCTLEYLEAGYSFSGELGPLPASLKTLIIGGRYTAPLSALPASLTHLRLESSIYLQGYNHPLGLLPATLQILEIDGEFNHDLGRLVPSLRELCFDGEFAQPLQRLPEGLTTLRLGADFNHPLGPLPSTLEGLVITSGEYPHSIDPIPASLTRLWRMHGGDLILAAYKNGVRV